MTMPTRTLLLCLTVSFIYLANTITRAQSPAFLKYYCENAANYTRNSTYQINLSIALSALPSTNSGLGFFNFSSGQGSDIVNSVALCRGDVNPDACLRCLDYSIVNLQQVCPNQKEAIGYNDNCLLRYSNQTVLGNANAPEISTLYLWNVQNATDQDRFNRYLRPFLQKLRAEAAAGDSLKKFASGNTTGPDFATIYGLMQCTPDLSKQECSDCLEWIVNLFVIYGHGGKVGGRTVTPTCNFRYEIYSFFSVSTLGIPPSPSSSPTPPIYQASLPVPAASPGKSSSTIVTIIVIISVVIVILIIITICISVRLRKRRKTSSAEKRESKF